ncbi:hypothetical protein H8959_007511 [Pygathrix nigripes]
MGGNQTSITEFLLLGFPVGPRIQMLLFGLFSLFYIFTLLGNGAILGLISLDSRLHTPMYFFLSHLAVVDIAYACNTVPQMLVNFLHPAKPISFAGCMTQMFLFLSFAHTECLLLVLMSYDRYVAICHPLQYSTIMTWKVCITLALTSWTLGVLLAVVHLMLLLPLSFCGPQKVNHFFCEITAVLKLACVDTHINENMESNRTWITEVILLGFQVDPALELFLFGFFLLFYSFTLIGNGIILGLICLDSRLHTPMYVFLSHLAIVDISYASSTVPKMLANLAMHKKVISFATCILQTFLYLAFAITECLILVVMCCDRYVAICHPLQYTLIMNWRVCTVLASTCWIFSFLLALVHITLILRLPFCGPQKIDHFFCQIMSVFKLACADTGLNQVVLFAGSVFVLVGPLCLVLVSYLRILVAILRI